MFSDQEIKPIGAGVGLGHAPVIIFEYNLRTGVEVVSPLVSQYIGGNYDGRLLSQVMLEDGIIHPQDVKKSLHLRQAVRNGQDGELRLRLKTPQGEFHWFRMILACSPDKQAERMIGIFQDIDLEIRFQHGLHYSATTDPASCIYNKQTFYEATEKKLAGAAELPHCLVRFDIDRFKLINEFYGVETGDLVLRQVGNILRALSLPQDIYGRLDNDVFGLCTRRSPVQAAELVLEIERRLNQYPLSFQFHLSAGIVSLTSYEGQPTHLLCDWAALAARTIKGNYIRKYAFYTPAMREAMNWEHSVVSGMRQALREQQFQVYLQPRYDMRTGEIVGAEALARWAHPSEGLLAAGQFIPLFEKNGCILQLDAYMWEETAKLLRSWIDRGIAPVPISVNVSRMHVHDLSFTTKIQEICRNYDISPALLELEITESAYVECPQALYDIMGDLQKQGNLFLMDDFGSGYSSLNVLKDMPVNVVKIDLNFLRDARRGKEAGRKILRAVVGLVQSIGLPIIVEGIETAEQAEFLLGIGCIEGQGFYFSRPLPVAEFELLLHNRMRLDRSETESQLPCSPV